MPMPLDLYSTEDHDYHLLHEAAREGAFSLRPGTIPVKRENRKRRARHSRLECTHRSQQM